MRVAPTVFALAAAAVSMTALAVEPAIPLGPDTTFFNGPLNPDGTVNYIEALDALARKGVTSDNNALVPLLKAVGTGPAVIALEVKAETLKRLGIRDEPGKMRYAKLVSLNDAKHADDMLIELPTRPWRAEQGKPVSDWLTTDAEAVELFIEASKRIRFYRPVVSKDKTVMGVVLPGLSQVRQLAELTAARAMLRLENGDLDGCVSDLLAVHRVGILMSQDNGLIDMLVGRSISDVAGFGDAALIRSGKLSAKQARAYLASLDAMPTPREPYEIIHTGERAMGLDAVTNKRREVFAALEKAAVGDGPRATAVAARLARTRAADYTPIFRELNRFYDDAVRAARQQDPGKRAQMTERHNAEVKACKKAYADMANDAAHGKVDFSDKDLATAFVAVMLPDLLLTVDLYHISQQRLDLVRVGLALAAFKAEKGAYPETLDAIAGDVKPMPIDRFSGGPLKYARRGDGFILYGVGQNGRDEGGLEPAPGDHKAADIVLTTDR